MDRPKPCRRPSSLRCTAWFSMTSSWAVCRRSQRNRSEVSEAVHRRGPSRPAERAAGRSRGAAGIPRGRRPVQFCAPISQLSMWSIVQPAWPSVRRGPISRSSAPTNASKWASRAAVSNLSHSSPRPGTGAGRVLAPGARAAEAQDRPVALRDVPGQAAVGRELVVRSTMRSRDRSRRRREGRDTRPATAGTASRPAARNRAPGR